MLSEVVVLIVGLGAPMLFVHFSSKRWDELIKESINSQKEFNEKWNEQRKEFHTEMAEIKKESNEKWNAQQKEFNEKWNAQQKEFNENVNKREREVIEIIKSLRKSRN